ncbi:MAG: hypothetical protein LC672_01650, partial [Acidobacteria bacterium]|nr:hypothetical protein [Acidobacteriota bacterium]
MRSKLFIFAWAFSVVAALALISAARADAQEGEPVVVDAVVAQVNGDVIMLSALKRELKDAVQALQ